MTPAGVENLGSAQTGLPTSVSRGIDQNPLCNLPEQSLFAEVDAEPWEMQPHGGDIIGASDVSNTSDSWLYESREVSRRGEQRRAEANYAQHKKNMDGSKFVIKTDSAGNIVTNKLRVTSAIKTLMGRYLDIAQVHYDDNDEKLLTVESIVRSSFDFEPPLKKNWFPTYMKKKLEKTRSEYRKYFDTTGQMHPECQKHKHPALLAWWTSAAGSSRSGRMKEINNERTNQRLSLNAGGIQSRPLGLPTCRMIPQVLDLCR